MFFNNIDSKTFLDGTNGQFGLGFTEWSADHSL